MFFGIIADLLTTVTTVLFPIFASYKALRTSDPAQTRPWLMYWTILSLVTAVENYTYFILSWIPFYSWFRLGLHLWLVAPGQQGATALYQQHLHPFLFEYESDIDEFIGSAHDKARKAGLEYLNRLIEYVKVNVMGLQPKPPAPPPTRGATYAQQLLSRFNMPAAGQSAPDTTTGSSGMAAAGDYLGLLASALQTATAARAGSRPASREATVRDLTSSGTLIPSNIAPEERLNYLSKQREGLQTLLQAFDREATHLTSNTDADPQRPRTPGLMSDLTKSRSEVDFERIETDEVAEGNVGRAFEKAAQAGGSWMPWNWAAKGGDDKPKQA